MSQASVSMDATTSSVVPANLSPVSRGGVPGTGGEFAAHLRVASGDVAQTRSSRAVRGGAGSSDRADGAESTERTDRRDDAPTDDARSTADSTGKSDGAASNGSTDQAQGTDKSDGPDTGADSTSSAGARPADAIAQATATAAAVAQAGGSAASALSSATAPAPVVTTVPTQALATAAKAKVSTAAATVPAPARAGGPVGPPATPAPVAGATEGKPGPRHAVKVLARDAAATATPPGTATTTAASAAAPGATATVDPALAATPVLPPTPTDAGTSGQAAAAATLTTTTTPAAPSTDVAAVVSATAAAPAPAPTSNAPQTSVAGQLAASLRTLQGKLDGVHVMTVRLHPDDLGPVRVVARLTGSDVALRVTTSTVAAAAALTEAGPRLHEALSGSGLTATDVSVDHDADLAGPAGQQLGQGAGSDARAGTGQAGAQPGRPDYSGRSHGGFGSAAGTDVGGRLDHVPRPRHPQSSSLDLQV